MTNAFNLRCPACGDPDHIDIQALVWVRLTPDGTDADDSHDGTHHWDRSSRFLCRHCARRGQVADLQAQLPPDPQSMNGERAERAGEALRCFRHATGTDVADSLPDLLCDLMHWADRSGFAFYAMLDRARDHYRAETTGGAV